MNEAPPAPALVVGVMAWHITLRLKSKRSDTRSLEAYIEAIEGPSSLGPSKRQMDAHYSLT